MTQDLINLQKAITNFYQNIRIAFHLLETNKSTPVGKILYNKYYKYLNNIAAIQSPKSTFTTQQLQQHLRYITGILNPLSSKNILELTELTNEFPEANNMENIAIFGKQIQNIILPLSLALRNNPSTSEDITTAAPNLINLLNKVGANLVTHIKKYMSLISLAYYNKLFLDMQNFEKLVKQS